MLRSAILAVAVTGIASGALAADPLPPHNWITPPDKGGLTQGRIAYLDGNELYEYCQSNELGCVLYIQGVVDGQLAAVTATSRDVAYCIPQGSTAGQMKDIVVKFLADHPERRHLMGGVLVANALSNAWPQCP